MNENPNVGTTIEQKAAMALERMNAEKAGNDQSSPIPAPIAEGNTEAAAPISVGHVSGQLSEEEIAKAYAHGPAEAPADAASVNDIIAGGLKAPATNGMDDEVIIGAETTPTEKPASLRDENDETIILSNIANEKMSNVPEDIRASFIADLMPSIKDYKKDLIINYGMSPDEAEAAAKNRISHMATEKATQYGQEHPEAVILTIDKSQQDQVVIDDDTARKMQVAKAIKLVVVENEELETLNLKPSNTRITMNQMRDISGSLSHFSIPLLDFGDYATFIGAQTGMLANAITDETDDMLDIVEKKAGILYRCFDQGTISSRFKKDEKGHDVPMTYEDFCNWYHYDDIDMGIYAVVVASAMEESESTYVCQNRNCGQVFPIRYNSKEILDLSAIPDSFKDRVNEIDASRSNTEAMKVLHAQYNKNIRVKSPVSQNIFDICNPTIAQVHQKFEKAMHKVTSTNAVDLVLLIYLERFYIYDKAAGNYAEVVVADDPEYAFDVLCTLTQVDVDILTKFIGEHKYSPSFKIKTKCPHCGREATDQLSLDNMLFIHARASVVEIQ